MAVTSSEPPLWPSAECNVAATGQAPHSLTPCRIVVSGQKLIQAVVPHSVNIFDFQEEFQMTEEQVGSAQPVQQQGRAEMGAQSQQCPGSAEHRAGCKTR